MRKKRRTRTQPNGPKAEEDRDRRGRFVKGHSIKSPGNPHLQRQREYNAAIREAVTVEDLRALFHRLLKMANQGDMMAARLVLDRALGKAAAAPSVLDPIDLGVESLATSQDVVRASDAILKGMVEGRLTPDDGAKLATIVELTRRAIETHELSERIAALEAETKV